jgi:hypothetical protein
MAAAATTAAPVLGVAWRGAARLLKLLLRKKKSRIGNNFQYSDHSRLENILLTLHLLWAVQQRSLPPPKKTTDKKKLSSSAIP